MRVNAMIRGYLNTIEAELREAFTKLYNNVINHDDVKEDTAKFINDMISLLDYYTIPIYKQALKTLKQYSKQEFIEDDGFILQLSGVHLAMFEERITRALTRYLNGKRLKGMNDFKILYDEILKLNVQEVIRLYKLSQLNILKQAGNHSVLFLTHDCDCKICNARHGSLINIMELTNELTNFKNEAHLLCASSYNPINDLKTKDINMTGKIQLYNMPVIFEKDIVKPLTKITNTLGSKFLPLNVTFTSDITNMVNISDNIRVGNTKHEIFSIGTKDMLYISMSNMRPLESIMRNMLTRFAAGLDLGWWDVRYREIHDNKHIYHGGIIYAQQFISSIAENSSNDYLIESMMAYILHPMVLKSLDNDAYTYLETKVFNGMI